MSATLLYLIRKARQAHGDTLSDEEAGRRLAHLVDILFDEVERGPDDPATLDELWEEIWKLSTLRHEDAIDLLEGAGGTGGAP